jgi:D-serine deaminase-like pyridoxal phosphate-dependent protein
MGQSSAPAVSATGSPSLESQTLSTLLQTQDLSQTQPHGHGGGGHHGAMKVMRNLAAEEAAESEEAKLLKRRKKLTKTVKLKGSSETVEVDENGVVVGENGVMVDENGVVVTRDVAQGRTDQPAQEDIANS